MKNIWLERLKDRSEFKIQLLTKNKIVGIYMPEFPGWFPGPGHTYTLPISKEDFKKPKTFRFKIEPLNAKQIHGFRIMKGEDIITQDTWQKAAPLTNNIFCTAIDLRCLASKAGLDNEE